MEITNRLESIKFQSESVINILPDDIDKSLLCTICQEILKIPRECKNCRNNFCKTCILHWMNEKNNQCPFRCPGEIKLEKSHRIILDSLRRLKFKCKNNQDGCDFSSIYENYITHVQNCEYKKDKCPNDLCSEIIFVKDLKFHLEEQCEHEVHKCKSCGFETKGTKKVPHECAKFAISLLNQLKSNIDNLMIKMNTKIENINKNIDHLQKVKNK
jgi:hypothetical protein